MTQPFRLLFLFLTLLLLICTPRQANAVDATMSWTDNSSGTTQEDFFEIQSATTSGGTYTTIGSAGQDAQTFVVDAGAPGTTMWYRMRGVNTIGNGSFSTPVSYTVPDAVTVPPQTGCIPLSVPPPGLVLALAMNENTGATLADSSQQGNTGTISGATWTTSGKYGNALTFDGVNDWVTVADSPSLDLSTGMTLEAWVYPTTIASATFIGLLVKESAPPAYEIKANNTSNRPLTGVNILGVNRTVTGTAQLALNTWTHVASTFDGAVIRLYINGAEVASTAFSGTMVASNGALRIGGNSLFVTEYLTGRIDEVRIYDRALTPAEIITDRDTPL